jgi:putative peptidoglycan lipid II flippase
MYQFPLGVFAIALATAIFPKLSEGAVDEDQEQFRSILRRGIEASLFIGLPASMGLVLVRYPAIRLLFERGHFTSTDTMLVARSTGLTAAAIWAFSLQQILNRAYYALARHDHTARAGHREPDHQHARGDPAAVERALAEAGHGGGNMVAFSLQAIVMIWMLDRKAGGLGLGARRPADREDDRRDDRHGDCVHRRAAVAVLPARHDETRDGNANWAS